MRGVRGGSGRALLALAVAVPLTLHPGQVAAQQPGSEDLASAEEPLTGPPEPGPIGPPIAPRPEPEPTRLPRRPYEPRYHPLAEVGDLLAQWASSAPGEIEAIDLAADGRSLGVPAIQWGQPGEVPLALRPTVFLIGGLDGVSLSGCEAVLSVADGLLGASLRPDLAFVAIPWASPEALASTLAGKVLDGRTATPLDEDDDGQVDEDGPDDVDRDGAILDMLIEDPAGPWTFAADTRFLAPARDGDSPRFRAAREGRDDDRDGRFNEDPPGGTNLDLNFPVGWSRSSADSLSGPYPLSEPVARAIADLVLARRTVAVLVFQGEHGKLAAPGGASAAPWPADSDARDFEAVTALFAKATARKQGRALSLASARGGARGGAAIDWVYAVPGALALEIAAWGPEVDLPQHAQDVALSDAMYGSSRNGAPARSATVSAEDQAWSRWLDNARGGIGFVDWHPVDLGGGVSGLVGGWEPFSRKNPPEESLSRALEGLTAFARELVLGLPRLEIRIVEAQREGEICRIRARIANAGTLPTGLWTTGRSSGSPERGGCELEVVLPPEARLLAGEPKVALGRLAGRSASREVSWVVLAAPGSVLSIRAACDWTLPIAREVTP